MAIIAPKDVFEFIGLGDDLQEKHLNMITNLIDEQQKELERTLRRKVSSQTASSVVLVHGKNARFEGKKIFLLGELADFYSITALTEEGTSLDQITSYNDGNDYVFNSDTGVLERDNYSNWSTEHYAVVISGKYGYVNSDDTARKDVKHLLIEMVAMRSGLWTKTFVSDGVTVTTEKDVDKYLMNKIKSHIRYSLI